MDKILNILLNRYNSMLSDLQNGYTMDNNAIKEMMWLLHILHFVSSEQYSSSESLEILAYYE